MHAGGIQNPSWAFATRRARAPATAAMIGVPILHVPAATVLEMSDLGPTMEGIWVGREGLYSIVLCHMDNGGRGDDGVVDKVDG